MAAADATHSATESRADRVIDLTHGTAPTQSSPNMIGRADELDRLGAAFEAVSGGRALAVLVGGDAGIGKSRLVEEFCDVVRLRGAAVATGVCVPTDGGLAFAPVMGILRNIGDQLGHPPSITQLLHALDGDSAVATSAPAETGLGTATAGLPAGGTLAGGAFAKTALFESILQSLIDLAHKSPVVLVFEDLHWVDSASSQLFDFLVRNLGDARVLTIGTFRTDELGHDHPLTAWFAEFGRHPRVTQLVLAPLGREDLAALMSAALGEPPSAARLDSVWTRSLGNPFFAEELLADSDNPALPMALRAVINNRVAHLTNETQNVLTVIATAGAVVDHRLVAAVAGLDFDALDSAIAESIDKKVLLVDESSTGYRFRHALLREAVYESLLPARRARLHRSIAVALTADPSLGSASPGHRIAELAAHWWAAGDWAAALQPSLQAADAAIAMYAFREALTLLEHALLADERVPSASAAAGVTRAQLLERASDVAYLAGANTRAVELVRAAIDAIDADAEPIVAARCYTLLGRNMWGIGNSAGAFEAYRTAIELLPNDEPSPELARLLAEQARGHMLLSHVAEAEKMARHAIEVARAVGARAAEGNALNTLGCCVVTLGFPDEGLALMQESLVIAEDIRSPEDLNRAYGNLAANLLEVGRLDDAASVMFDSAAIGEELWGARLNGASGNGVEALVRMGRYSEALQVLAQLGTQTLGVCVHSAWTLPSPVMIRQGRFDVAEQTIATARAMMAQLDDVQVTVTICGLAAELELERERPAVARAELERALALVVSSDDDTLLPEVCMWLGRALADVADAAHAHGRAVDAGALRRRADEIVSAVQASVERAVSRRGVPTPRALAASAQTVAERSRLDRSDADAWAEAAARWRTAHERYPEAYCLWREAEALLESKAARGRATECLDEAWRIVRDLGTEPLGTRIKLLAQRGRLDLNDGAIYPPSAESLAIADLGLTAREVEILGQLASGRSDREIAEALFISKKTVSVHVSNVLRKLAVAGRVEAGKIGQAHGLGVNAYVHGRVR